ncbi:SLAIN motif-containing protein 1a isoform X2 [Scophthalmus maximus]|uniref:SLAIN motif-containing protein 1a isoform X2 n=1 Tax=Scophthalmus maximus TaxID=52904 RepID=UPI001FA8DD93|nr:SLAIN motif-containing protein 1a isoform X2 [Scophthalmus maximus]
MEAEVLNPQVMMMMMADVNGNSKIANAELEVLKLQELVRKLERQNERLRTRANAANNRSVTAGPRAPSARSCPRGGGGDLCATYGVSSPTQSQHPPGATEEPFAYFHASSVSGSEEEEEEEEEESAAAGASTVLDEVDILDLSAALPVAEPESWLYVSPKAKLQGESLLRPLQWCRQVLDHPGPEVELAKMTFCHRLDQAKRWRGVSSVRPYSCIEGLSTLSCPVLPYTKSAALTEPPAPLPSPGPSFLQPSLPRRASCNLSDRAPTFLSNSALHNVGRRHAAISPQSSLDSEVGVSELEDDSISMSYKLQDMTDVEVMARLQEESLRQDYASTSATASRRSSSFSLHSLRRSEMDLEEEDEEDEGYDQLPPPQPRLFRTGSMQRGGLPHSHTFSSIRDCRRNSTTPQFSLSGLSQYSGPCSLTTETHTAYRNSTVPSPGQLSQRVQSVANFPTTPRHPLKATAYVSPTVQQGPASTPLSTSVSLHSIPSCVALPQPLKPSNSLVPQPLKASANQPTAPRSSLPRPASFIGTSGVPRASKIPPPTRSLLTPPKSMAALSALRDGSWKDGCY